MIKKFFFLKLIVFSFDLFADIDNKFIIFFTNTKHQNNHVFDFYSKVDKILKSRLDILNVPPKNISDSTNTKWMWLEQKSFHKYLLHAMQKKRVEKERLISARVKILQVMENVAIDNSIIVDCKESSQFIKSCGIYYYSTTKKNISSNKSCFSC